ncbi:hypothetical protein RND81_01G147100 [Saponaria officinalis]|uniref:RING-type domain-containing protein n=1 Tax=Saponaria officinalis TaxID=3572 RepID=A0AAW1NE79_SAPOF
MSTRVSRCVSQRGAGPSSQRKKIVLEVDLNVPPPDHFQFNDVGPSTNAPIVPEMRGCIQRHPPPPVTIDVDSIEDDDDVVLSSPRAFVEAKTNSRRTRSRNNVVDVESEAANREAANVRNKRHRIPPNQPIINCESYVIPETNDLTVGVRGRNMAAQTRMFAAPPPPPPPPPPPEPVFSCPVCMSPLEEEMTTKCGHIFCKACIKKAIAVQGKCPTCRRKVTMRDTIRIFLPKTS